MRHLILPVALILLVNLMLLVPVGTVAEEAAPALAEAKPQVMFLGFADDKTRVDPSGIITMTVVTPQERSHHAEMKKAGRIWNEQIIRRQLYYAIKSQRSIEQPDGTSKVLFITERFKTTLPEKPEEPKVQIKISSRDARKGAFIGIGYHAFFPIHQKQTTPEIEKMLHERWKDLSPSFARVTHQWDWNVEHAARQIAMMKETGTLVYLTTWDPENLETAAERDAYAAKVADLLHDLIVVRKLDNIRWYCMTNELSLPKEWAAMFKDLPKFEDYHRRIYKAIKERGLKVDLLASDASPTWQWSSIEWAMKQMDDVTGAYGGHHYVTHEPDDLALYDWFYRTVQPLAAKSHELKKPFIMGEFGTGPDGAPRHGYAKYDGCKYFNTPQEPMAALQVAETAMAAVNAGADAIGYWTFADFPDDYRPTYANKWGTFRWSGTDFGRRSFYFSIGLLTRFFRGPGTVLPSEAAEGVHALAIAEQDGGRLRVAVINRREEPIEVSLLIDGAAAGGSWDWYVFNPHLVARWVDKVDSLLNKENLLQTAGKAAAVTVPPQSLVVLVQQEK